MMLLYHCKNSFFLGHVRINYVKASVKFRTHSTMTCMASDLFPSLNSKSGCYKEDKIRSRMRLEKVMPSCIYLEQS